MAESEGFEPPSPRGLTVFKTAAFDRSANSPLACFGKDFRYVQLPRRRFYPSMHVRHEVRVDVHQAVPFGSLFMRTAPQSCNAVALTYRWSLLSLPKRLCRPRTPLATGAFSTKLWLQSSHRRLPSAHDADTCDEILGVSADDACGAPTGSAARASITAQSVQPTGRSVRRAKLPAARVVGDAVSAKATAGYMRAASEISDRVWTPGEIARLAD